MKVNYCCEFCGEVFTDCSECKTHELSHQAMYFNQEEIKSDGIQHSGYCANSAPVYLYLPMKIGVEQERIYGEYIFVRRLTRMQYLSKYNKGEIVDD